MNEPYWFKLPSGQRINLSIASTTRALTEGGIGGLKLAVALPAGIMRYGAEDTEAIEAELDAIEARRQASSLTGGIGNRVIAAEALA